MFCAFCKRFSESRNPQGAQRSRGPQRRRTPVKPRAREQALERWDAAVHLHEDLRGRPLTPQEYQQQIEINGPRWEHHVVLAQPVDGTQNFYERPYTQITLTDQTIFREDYERLLERNGPDWQHSVVIREPFPLDPDSRFQEIQREWSSSNAIYRSERNVPISPQEYQSSTESRAWHQDSQVIVMPPLEVGLHQDFRLRLTEAEAEQLPHISHAEYRELVQTNGPEWRHSVVVMEPPPRHIGMDVPTSWRAEAMSLEQSSSSPEEKIVPYAKTDWSVEMDGAWEHRIHFGRSDEGHHFATERSYLGGDMGGSGEPGWSIPYASHQEASHAAHEAISQMLSENNDNGLSIG